jgi:hypothetical protein
MNKKLAVLLLSVVSTVGTLAIAGSNDILKHHEPVTPAYPIKNLQE